MFRNKKYMAWNFHLFSYLVSVCCETFRNISKFGYVSMFRNKKYMAWNFHLFSNLVSVCCETFRNISKFGLSHFWVCFNLFQSIYYIIYMFQCFATRNIWPGIFTFSLTLFRFVAKRFETFKKFGLSHFWVCFNLFQLIYYIHVIYMLMFRNKKYMAWNFQLFSNLVSVCCETFRNIANFRLSHFWVCFNLFQSIYYIIYMFQCFATRNIWPGIFTFSLTLFRFVAKRFETFKSSDLVIFGSVSICFS